MRDIEIEDLLAQTTKQERYKRKLNNGTTRTLGTNGCYCGATRHVSLRNYGKKPRYKDHRR